MTADVGPGDDEAALRARALDLLARREHARRELAGKLVRKGGDAAAVSRVLDRLEDDGLLSDLRFAELYVESRSGRGFGPLRIRDELRQRGVTAELRDAMCPERDPRWTAQARRARRKRFGDEPPGEFLERARQARFLTGRGFSRDQVAAALGADPEDAD